MSVVDCHHVCGILTSASAARGNTSLESAVSLTKDIREDIQSLGNRISKAASSEELLRKGAKPSKNRAQNDAEIKHIIRDIKALLDRIEDAVPLMSLAITTSGAKLSTSLPSTVSPSRLLQASTFLSAGDTRYSVLPSQAVQIGPTFTLSMYMLFASHVRPHDEEGIREATWKEVMHKARLKLRRVPMHLAINPDSQDRRIPADARVDEFAYQLLIIEDLHDGRVHTFEDNEQQPESYDDVATAGMREILPVHQISKIFYADTGKLLNINPDGETNNPVLLLKRDIHAIPPRRMMEREEAAYDGPEPEPEQDEAEDEAQAQLDAQLNAASTPGSEHSYHEDSIPKNWRLPQDLDPEWIAFEVYTEDDESSDTESEAELSNSPSKPGAETIDPEMMAKLSIDPNDQPSPSRNQQLAHYDYQAPAATTATNPVFVNIRTSLSLLETLLRLTSLQQFQQQSHLSISDELLNFFLEESSTTGAGGDEHHRQRVRAAARGKVGFDPFDESPIKRRGEDHMYNRTPGSTPARDDVYSPSTSNIPETRSRENTPETPLPSRQSPSVRSSAGRRNAVRGSSAYADEALRRGSPLAKSSTAARGDDDVVSSKEKPRPGSANTSRSTAGAANED